MSRHHWDTVRRRKDRALLKQAGGPCHICGKPIDYSLMWPDPQAFVADHVVALNRGGADHISNKRAAHALCNGRKATKPHADIIRRSGALS